MRYALIDDSIVTNIIELHPSNADDFPNAVCIHSTQIEIGDSYSDGQFFRDEKPILDNPYENEKYGIAPEIYKKIAEESQANPLQNQYWFESGYEQALLDLMEI